MLHPFVECEFGPGLRDGKVQVTVRDMNGGNQRLRVPRAYLREEAGTFFLPIGIVGRHPTEDRVLIEFPHEADSGANRIWVPSDRLLKYAVERSDEWSDEDLRDVTTASLTYADSLDANEQP